MAKRRYVGGFFFSFACKNFQKEIGNVFEDFITIKRERLLFMI